MKRISLILTLFFVLSAKAQQVEQPLEDGKIIFKKNCVRCHGYDGKLGQLGAKNLQTSTLNDNRLLTIIANGKWRMPKWKKVLTPEQITAIVVYIKTLRKVDTNNNH